MRAVIGMMSVLFNEGTSTSFVREVIIRSGGTTLDFVVAFARLDICLAESVAEIRSNYNS